MLELPQCLTSAHSQPLGPRNPTGWPSSVSGRGRATFAQDVHGVAPLQSQVPGPLGRVAVLGYYLVENRAASCSL